MVRLTLKTGSEAVTRARQYAMRLGASISRLGKRVLTILSRGNAQDAPDGAAPLPPVLARLRRELGGSTLDARIYREYIERKHR